MVQIVPYRQEVGVRPVAGEKQRAVQVGFGQDIGQAASNLGQAVSRHAEVWERQRIAQDEASAMELDTGFAREAREIQTGFLSMNGRNAVDAAEQVRGRMDELETRYRGMAQNERQRGMLGRVLGRRREQFDGTASTHLLRETETYLTTATTARIAEMSTGLVSMPEGPERLAGIQAVRNEIDAKAQRLGLDRDTADVEFLETISGVHEATIGALVEAGTPLEAKDYVDRWAPQIKPDVLNRINESVRKEVYQYRAVTHWDENPVERPAPTVTAVVEGSPVTVTLRPPVGDVHVSSAFGVRRSPGGVGSTNHGGVDYAVPVNTPVTASAPGVVRWRDDPDGYGRYAVVDHGNGMETVYAHLSRGTVAEGTRVEQGDVIAMSGGQRGAAGAGNSQGPHVHYEVRQNGEKVNPARALGGEVTVAPGAGGAQSAGLPTTLDDVLEAADAAAGDDWRYREVLRAEGIRRFSQGRSARADVENEAERALQEYLPGGSKAVTSASDIPRAIIGAVSPATARAATLSIEADVRGENAIDMPTAYDLFNDLVDESRLDPTSFAARGEFTQYRGQMTDSMIGQLRSVRRDLFDGAVGGAPPRAAQVNSLLSGVSEVMTAYMTEAGIDAKTIEGAEKKARLTQWLLDAANNMETPPDRDGMVGLLRLGLRTVSPADGNADGTRGQARAFELQGPARFDEVMSRDQRTAATRALRAQFPNVTTFTEAQIAAQHRALTYRGQ